MIKNPLNHLMILSIRFYQYLISPILASNCRYIPTCSNYSIQAFKTYGFFKGIKLTILRITKCHPFGGSGYDPVMVSDKICIKRISLSLIRKKRMQELYRGLPVIYSSYKEDKSQSTIHLGLFLNKELITGLTLIKNKINKDDPSSFQIRGMFTISSLAKKGYGSKLINYVKKKFLKKNTILWCNSRKKVIGFYKKNGFKELGNFFLVKGIGIHKKLLIMSE